MGKYKLIEGSPGHYRDWYPPQTDRKATVKIERSQNRVEDRHRNYTLLYDVESKTGFIQLFFLLLPDINKNKDECARARTYKHTYTQTHTHFDTVFDNRVGHKKLKCKRFARAILATL